MGDEECIQNHRRQEIFPREREGGIDGMITCEDVNWIHLAQGTVQWKALVNTAMNLHVS
jgi:hypothetical protein